MARRFSLESMLTMSDGFSKTFQKANRAATSFSNQMKKSFGRVNASLAASQVRMENMSSRMAPIAMAGMGMTQAGRQISGAGKSILSTFGSIIEEGSAFERKMSEVAALAVIDKTSDDFKRLEKTAMDLGASTEHTAIQIAGGMKTMATAGYDATQQIDSMASILDLAIISGLEISETATIATNALSQFRMESSEMGSVTNAMAAAMTKSKITLVQLN